MFTHVAKTSTLCFLALMFSMPSISNASSFSGNILSGGSSIVGEVDSRSYDGTGYNAFASFGSFADTSSILTLNSFMATSTGMKVEAFLLSEVAGYANVNSFGLVNTTSSEFTELLAGQDTPGSIGSLDVGAGEDYEFALKSPEGLFTTDASSNADKTNHILAMEVTTAGTVTIDRASLSGASLTFNLMVGDVVLFMEDLLLLGNTANLPSDFDYNDMVVVVRGTAVPEPASMLLLGGGLLGLGVFKRKRS